MACLRFSCATYTTSLAVPPWSSTLPAGPCVTPTRLASLPSPSCCPCWVVCAGVLRRYPHFRGAFGACSDGAQDAAAPQALRQGVQMSVRSLLRRLPLPCHLGARHRRQRFLPSLSGPRPLEVPMYVASLAWLITTVSVCSASPA